MQAAMLAHVGASIGSALGRAITLRSAHGVGGGCIHRAYRVSDGERDWFVKIGSAGQDDMFAAEADGLTALARAGARAPDVVCRGTAAEAGFLVLEWLRLGAATLTGYARLGEALARLHACCGPDFGWQRDNYIGATPQINARDASWCAFYARARLRPQLERARANGHGALGDLGERVIERLPQLLRAHKPRAALLHGDLWSGNAGFIAGAIPVLFDPAVYYGDAEADLAMTELFGGFPDAFYAAYRAHAPLDAGYATRKTLYQLYHVLNHCNLFGGGYAGQARAMCCALLAETGA